MQVSVKEKFDLDKILKQTFVNQKNSITSEEKIISLSDFTKELKEAKLEKFKSCEYKTVHPNKLICYFDVITVHDPLFYLDGTKTVLILMNHSNSNEST